MSIEDQRPCPKPGIIFAGIQVKPQLDNPDIPYWEFPPFPIAPQTLILFKDFKPKGIVIPIEDNEDEVELDGLGIATTALKVIHDGNASKKKKKKVKAQDGIVVALSTWWEDWEEGEALRTATKFDEMTDRADRLHQLHHDFKANRKFNSDISVLYDEFRLWIGLIEKLVPKGKKRQFIRRDPVQGDTPVSDDKNPDENDNEPPEVVLGDALISESQDLPPSAPLVDDDDDGDNDGFDDPSRPTPFNGLPFDASQDRMDAFFDDPAQSMRIFFSSHFRDRGLLWMPSNLFAVPTLVRFFIGFALRHRAFPEYERGFKNALEVVIRAQEELPKTKDISLALPDAWGNACKDLWGSVIPNTWGSFGSSELAFSNANADDDTNQPSMSVLMEDDIPTAGFEATLLAEASTLLSHSGINGGLNDVSKANLHSGSPTIEGLSDGKYSDEVALTVDDTATSPPTNSVEDQQEFVDTDMGDGIVTPMDLWGGSTPEFWGEEPGPVLTWDEVAPPPKCFDFVGPALFPNTHAPVRAEKSIRTILSISPPVESTVAGASHLHTHLGSVVLGPWRNYPLAENTELPPPELVLDKSAEFGLRDAYDPLASNITVLVDPAIIPSLGVGFGLGGIWVQIAEKPIDEAEDGEDGAKRAPAAKKKKSKSKSKAKGDAMDGKQWWYVENVSQVLVSFWTPSTEW